MKSSLGTDELDPYLLKIAVPVIAVPLTHIFNLALIRFHSKSLEISLSEPSS